MADVRAGPGRRWAANWLPEQEYEDAARADLDAQGVFVAAVAELLPPFIFRADVLFDQLMVQMVIIHVDHGS